MEPNKVEPNKDEKEHASHRFSRLYDENKKACDNFLQLEEADADNTLPALSRLREDWQAHVRGL